MTLRKTTTAAAVTALVAVAALGTVIGTRTGAEEAAPVPDRARHLAHADCLWRTTREHGLYAVLGDVLDGSTGVADRALWQAFGRSIGAEDCGFRPEELPGVERALAATRDEADRRFLATR